MIALSALLAATLTGLPAVSAQERLPGGAAARALSDGMDEMRAGDWSDALSEAAKAGPVARDVFEWHRLRAGRGTFDEAIAFLRRRGDWPGLPYLKEQMEESLPFEGRGPDVIAFFADTTPETGHGAVALVEAFAQIGNEGDAQAEATLAWLTLPMDAESEALLLARYPDVLEPHHRARLDMLLWRGAEAAARRMLARVDDTGLAALAEARLALRQNRAGVDDLIEAVPAALQSDPGLAYERFRWRLGHGLKESAIELMIARSSQAADLGQADAWAAHRGDLARELMRAGDHETAYAVAAAHHLREGGTYSDLEWLSGYLALRFLDAPAKALEHFRHLRLSVDTPISLGRAGYWEGRAHEALGDVEGAQAAYAFGAEYQTSFYGLLAAERGGLPLDPALTGKETYPSVSVSAFRDSSVLEAALLLQSAGERDLAERFMVHLGETLTETELGTLADVALALGEPHIALRVAKQAARMGYTLPRSYFPVIELGVADMPVSRELALAIARRESEFNPGVSSGVGARGLMQLMPGTARDVAREIGVAYSSERLFTDPSYNARLGTTYLAGLIRQFGDTPVLVSAGYNAGPGRPLTWMRDRGDPRSDEVDVVDWIEHIPFDETRNYVMRVAESLPVYRARLTGETGPLNFTDELKGR
ncbi:lytic transglycosylase domain-containing protein [Mesobaculum littorinae]|uniref:Lytic transglycosylase domain-containing protein n=2 Tax=Mesobaculum littorinae TaxID=2486419 RepID=A0A438AK36_9RHOB|nr:lytic transglycosylase domain-containing protein [Mesobaculum littorinae]